MIVSRTPSYVSNKISSITINHTLTHYAHYQRQKQRCYYCYAYIKNCIKV